MYRLFFAVLCCWLYYYGLSEHKFFMCKGQIIFSVDHEKGTVELFDAGILRV